MRNDTLRILERKDCIPVCGCASRICNCNVPDRSKLLVKVRLSRGSRMDGQPRRRHVGPKHDAANRRQENEAQNDERDIFHPAKARGTLFLAARGHNMKARRDNVKTRSREYRKPAHDHRKSAETWSM